MKKLVFSFILMICVAVSGFAQEKTSKATKDESTPVSISKSKLLSKGKTPSKASTDKAIANMIIKGEDVVGKSSDELLKEKQKQDN